MRSRPRFDFGDNWTRYLTSLNDVRISAAEVSLKELLGEDDLGHQSFLDVGSGSGLSSLVARRLGARVHSFDIDSECVACTQRLKNRFFADDREWTIEQGSILEESYLTSLGQYDVVYSWGVLHHTGAMWEALANVGCLVKPGGRLFIAIYNHQGKVSDFWRTVKKLYNRLPSGLRFILTWPALVFIWGPGTVKDFLTGKPFATWRNYAESRGMSPWHDLIDWVGGYPFEVARPDLIIKFYQARGYQLLTLKSCGGGRGCNQFVFKKL